MDHEVDWEACARDDDTLVSLFVQQIYLPIQLRKFQSLEVIPTESHSSEVQTILQENIAIETPDIHVATTAFLQLEAVIQYMDDYVIKEREDYFIKQCYQYLAIANLKCKFRLETIRFGVGDLESSVIATRRISKSETIKFLDGTAVEISERDFDGLCARDRAVSVLKSKLRKVTTLLLGIARFINHSCEPNSEAVVTSLRRGIGSVRVNALMDIQPDTEITISYGEDYFGPRNIDCLCSRCRTLRRNGWRPIRLPDDDDDLQRLKRQTPWSPTKTRKYIETNTRSQRPISQAPNHGD